MINLTIQTTILWIFQSLLQNYPSAIAAVLKTQGQSPADTGRKLNVLKTLRRRPVCLLNVLCTFNLRPVSTGSLLLLEEYDNLQL